MALRLLLAGVVATFACGALMRLGEIFGLVGTKPMAELLIAAVLLKLYPEKIAFCWSAKRVLGLFGLGCGLALFWVAVFAWGNTIFPDLSKVSSLAIFIGVLSAVITAPLYEEKVVRHLLLSGLSGLVGPWISTIIVSIVFAIAHKNAVVWSFLVSIVLCWLAISRDIGTLQRAIVHSTINSLVMMWYFTSGFGFFN